ncbi:MAG TPA: serine hydrolase domain-containing protein [Acidimicrobiales bacterium]|nr:serine hydrolase domain-containing protein [Acidimicrobiales bacterium]
MEDTSDRVEVPGHGEVTVHGHAAPGFEGVRAAFTANFVRHGEVGAAFCLVVDGRTVVDLWGGVADVASGAPYERDSLQLVFSSTKGVTALCAALLARRGVLDVDAPVAELWPEFAARGKAGIPVRWLLCHKAGLPYIDTPVGLDDLLAWDPAVDALAAMAPLWEPGTAHGYHAVTFGWLVGEVIRRAAGRSVGRFLADEVAGPLGLDLWIGLPAEHQRRVAPLTNRALPEVGADRPSSAGPAGSGMVAELERVLGPDSMLVRALGASVALPLAGDGVFNRPEVRAAELPSANGVTTARSLARMYAAVIGAVEGVSSGPLLAPEDVAAVSTTQTSGTDRTLLVDSTFGLGFMTSSPVSPYGGPRSFGHTGAGGSVGFADPENGLGFGYVMNRMAAGLAGDPRSSALVRAAYEAIGVPPRFA